MLSWYTTVSKTRVLFKDKERIGHTRNIGPKQWYAEYYPSKKTELKQSLQEAKNWLELIHGETK